MSLGLRQPSVYSLGDVGQFARSGDLTGPMVTGSGLGKSYPLAGGIVPGQASQLDDYNMLYRGGSPMANTMSVQNSLSIPNAPDMTLNKSIAGGASALGMVVPGLGIAGQLYGLASDWHANKVAEKKMNEQLELQRQARDYKAQKYMTELDRDAGRRQLAMRGQIANSPLYQSQLGRMAQQYGNAGRMVADNQQKLGMGEKAGMSAQLASQNLNNMLGSNTAAATQALGSLNRAYGGLAPTAVSSAPERDAFALGEAQYKESSDYGGNLKNIMRLGNTAAKYYIGDAYRDDMYNDINAGFGLGKSGGN